MVPPLAEKGLQHGDERNRLVEHDVVPGVRDERDGNVAAETLGHHIGDVGRRHPAFAPDQSHRAVNRSELLRFHP
jgi:hypothetical protein